MTTSGRSSKALLGAAGIAVVLLAATGVALADNEGQRGFFPLALNGPAQATSPYPTATAVPATAPPAETPPPTSPYPTSPYPTSIYPTSIYPTSTPPAPTCTPLAPVDPIVVIPRGIDPTEWANDAAAIQAVALEGDRLTLTIRHGGGCFQHDQWLVASSWFMESYPPQVDVLLSHDAHGDLCRALITRDVAFDLGPLKRKAVEGTSVTSGVVLLRIRGWTELVRYEFGP